MQQEMQTMMELLRSRHQGRNAKISIEGSEAIATTAEGLNARMPLDLFLAKLAPATMHTDQVMLPDGVVSIQADGSTVVWIHQNPPQVYTFDWIANNSPAPFGRGTRYRKVRLALPYLVTLAVYAPNETGQVCLSGLNECFFRNSPLKSLADPLQYPALLNVSKFEPQEGRPLAWICTQHMTYTPQMRSADVNERFRSGFHALRHCLLESAFNHSSDHHEAASWFTASQHIDPRISSVEAWEEASARDPLFVLDVPWLETGHTVAQVVERIFKNLGANRGKISSASALARIIFNHK